jgi:hypothetical protein
MILLTYIINNEKEMLQPYQTPRLIAVHSEYCVPAFTAIKFTL